MEKRGLRAHQAASFSTLREDVAHLIVWSI